MTHLERARKSTISVMGYLEPAQWQILQSDIKSQIEEACAEAVRTSHYELAQKQANVMGESVMLCGKLVTNEELYKQPTDYVKEAYAEGFSAAQKQAVGIAHDYTALRDSSIEIERRLREMKP